METGQQIENRGEDYCGFALFFIRKLLSLKEGETYTAEEGFFSFSPSDFGWSHPGKVDKYFKEEGLIYARCVSDDEFGEEKINVTAVLKNLLPEKD
ncbi:MAG: hypothetical protein ACMUJM_10390 [bacterium]